jgi:hypothetical protein
VLDFWLGEWSVRTRDGAPAGTNLVECVLGGHAVLEHWRSVAGDEGKSLFHLDRPAGTWKQVRVMHSLDEGATWKDELRRALRAGGRRSRLAHAAAP